VGADVGRWRDPLWQRHATALFAALHADVQLVDRAGLVYTTDEAIRRNWQSTAVQQKFGIADAAATSVTPASVRLVIRAPAALYYPATDRRPLGIAYIWFSLPLPGMPPSWIVPVADLIAALLALAASGWFLARQVLQPLAAMSRAARQIGGGEWDIQLPGSRAREVAEVSTALTGMSMALQEALERQVALEEERRLFIGAIAHDLRTPLFALRGYLQGLERGVVTTPERMAHYIRACSVRAEALEQLIAGLFAYAQIEYLDQEPQREPLELGELLTAAADVLRSAASAKGIALVLAGPPAPCPFRGARALLERAIQNLLDNAIRHTPSGGHVCVRWLQEEDRLVFQVEDTGAGIAPDVLPHLFTPLYRGEPSRNRQTGGAGLGLTIARRILRVHGGDLTAANSAVGGAAFTGTIPTGRHPAQPVDQIGRPGRSGR
jgi:signal transduction histidine kinase